MSKMKISELRTLIREELTRTLIREFESKSMPNGTSWKTAGRGWAAKNTNGLTNYWYGKDEAKNKESADKWTKDTSKKPTASTASTK